MTQQKTGSRGSGKLLQFERDSEFHYRSGMAKLDKNDLAGAMFSYRRALEKDGRNPYAILGVAELLSAMERFDESNRLMMLRLQGLENCPPEAYFGMGCNFMATMEYIQAQQCFDKYLSLEPMGEFAPDAYDMAEAIDRGEFEPEEGSAARLRQRVAMGRDLIDREKFSEAIGILEDALSEDPGLIDARNYLTLAYFSGAQYDRAMEQVRYVLEREPDNIQARCNLAIFLKNARDEKALAKQLEYLGNAKPANEEDAGYIAFALMETGRFAEALPLMRELARKRPYDEHVLHRFAVCRYNTGDYAGAQRIYEKLTRLNGADSIASYYRRLAANTAAGAKKKLYLPLNYQVPADEIVHRIRRLNEYINMGGEELRQEWQKDSGLQSLVLWTMELPAPTVKRAVLNFVSFFGDERAEYILRDFVLRKEQDDAIKREVFGMLKSMGAKEPYLCYINGEFMRSYVTRIPRLTKKTPAAYRRVLDICIESIKDHADEESMLEVANIWGTYLDGLDSYRPLSRQQTEAMAAALEYRALKSCGIRITKREICAKYDITMQRLSNALAKLNGPGGER